MQKQCTRSTESSAVNFEAFDTSKKCVNFNTYILYFPTTYILLYFLTTDIYGESKYTIINLFDNQFLDRTMIDKKGEQNYQKYEDIISQKVTVKLNLLNYLNIKFPFLNKFLTYLNQLFYFIRKKSTMTASLIFSMVSNIRSIKMFFRGPTPR